MNKRIEEIAIQAKAWFPIGCPSAEGGDDAWTNLVIFEKETLEKFAELIIREAAEIATKNQYEAHTTGYYVLKEFGIDPRE